MRQPSGRAGTWRSTNLGSLGAPEPEGACGLLAYPPRVRSRLDTKFDSGRQQTCVWEESASLAATHLTHAIHPFFPVYIGARERFFPAHRARVLRLSESVEFPRGAATRSRPFRESHLNGEKTRAVWDGAAGHDPISASAKASREGRAREGRGGRMPKTPPPTRAAPPCSLGF